MSLRENKIDIQGRSLLLNILSIIFNVAGVYFIAYGFHESAGENSVFLKTVGFATFLIGIIGLIALKGLYMFSFVARAFVGGLFIVSGLVKANDPWGFAFKLEEYFSPSGLAFDFPFFAAFEGVTLELSILVCIAEIVLGVAVIVGGKIKLTSWLLVLMMVFFTWLTYYTSSCVDTSEMLTELRASGEVLTAEQESTLSRDCVRDCGCFGDALRGSVGRSLTPYESFWKDIVLFYFVLIIFFCQRKIELNTYRQNWVMVPGALLVVVFFSWVFGWYFPIIFYTLALLGAFVFGNMNIGKIQKPWKMAIFVTLISFIFSMYTTVYLPVKDYRAYAVNNNIVEKMNDGVPQLAEYVYYYENVKTGIVDTVKQWDSKYGNAEEWKPADPAYNQVIVVEGRDPSISDFGLTTDYENLTETERSNPVLDSIISVDFENYYEEKLKVKSVKGEETIYAGNYVPYEVDTTRAFGQDTIFYTKVSKPFYGLYDTESRFSVDVTDYVLSLDKVILMTIRDMKHVNETGVEDAKAVYLKAVEEGIPFYILSPASGDHITEFRSKYEFDAPVLAIDGTEIKIIVRSNPGIVILKQATVIDKWGSRSIPNFEDIKEKLN